ncbi:5-formyltetrahydrofolate cyclo-ligase [Bifidobacterium sp. ESL0728]|uniref:5-formyltetrahydrofolate cyclo-ligase n=1 Tax=Bifidobacterium sp. ESL0728 TaxID=2983220 RepID=UPI0023F9EF45|nr:5-formyltetrahydrofolate cyclo-ligase [Bifidobacterium sp. ESL0728]WEV59404.1 5-formyltetrahydrofolate cyclo-ligase [Bifidobacterium sp. ESL0728]
MDDNIGKIDACKQGMRHEAIGKRKEMSESQRAEAGKRLGKLAASLLNKLPTSDLKSGDTAAAYVSMGTEVPTLELLDELCERKLRVLVPRLGKGRDIGWSEYGGKSGLRKMPRTATGGLRPAEPGGKTLGPKAIADAKLVFIPAFAIDLDGTRLGRGGGWYDQVLGLCRTDMLKIGVCWDWEFIDRHDAVPHETHDIPVDVVMTDKRIIVLSAKFQMITFRQVGLGPANHES